MLDREELHGVADHDVGVSIGNPSTPRDEQTADGNRIPIRLHTRVSSYPSIDTMHVASHVQVATHGEISGVPNLAEIFGVPFNTLADIENLMNDIEMGKHEGVWSVMTCEQYQDIMAENPSELNDKTVGNTAEVTTNDDTTHVDNSPIVQLVIIQDQPRSYVGATGGSKLEPNKSKANFRSLSSKNLCE
ncbi:hypothetical protein Tco_1015837 [Tanacetum coccineum]|uniref:Uncharacterized protein n=1 Tax=Tanacetum coccineum TaxID=301880 RepID=A0ABQ5FPD5_9ASTR